MRELKITRLDGFTEEHESRVYPDGSALVRGGSLPWIAWADGLDAKVLSIDWEKEMMVFLLKNRRGLKADHHCHVGAAYGYLVSGFVETELGDVHGGDLIIEPGGVVHDALSIEESIYLSIVFYGVGGLDENGEPDDNAVLDCMGLYQLAVGAGCADHLTPPPEGWSRQVKAERRVN
ncbi:cupin domain-containing protein [Croceicoccus sediminis]|uniref:cupin domain-containing protein n=1 Tax=Croceicoccus sediminis TaxID=2571150 RepID=UPI001183FB70|nr:hypothetical protein [Croceicoccus sediminis]